MNFPSSWQDPLNCRTLHVNGSIERVLNPDLGPIPNQSTILVCTGFLSTWPSTTTQTCTLPVWHTYLEKRGGKKPCAASWKKHQNALSIFISPFTISKKWKEVQRLGGMQHRVKRGVTSGSHDSPGRNNFLSFPLCQHDSGLTVYENLSNCCYRCGQNQWWREGHLDMKRLCQLSPHLEPKTIPLRLLTPLVSAYTSSLMEDYLRTWSASHMKSALRITQTRRRHLGALQKEVSGTSQWTTADSQVS